MSNYAKTGGILSIISGAFGLLGAGLFLLFFLLMSFAAGTIEPDDSGAAPFLMAIFSFYGIIGFTLLVLAVLAIVGGIYSIKRKNFVLSLAAAIAGIITFLPTGIAATIYVSLGNNEFSAIKSQPPPTPQPAPVTQL